jgi:tetratricopeptide (TPR) repeat protein
MGETKNPVNFETDSTQAGEPKDAELAAPAKTSHRRRPWWKTTVFALLAACLFFVGSELLVRWFGDPAPRSPHLDGTPAQRNNQYPDNPDEYVKIAVFGGSASEGAYSPRAFDRIIEHELAQRFPDRKVYVRNYAQSGYPFHRHQAEYVKLLIDKYDLFLIYCGNNEAENWFDDSGYWRHSQYKNARNLVFHGPEEAFPESADRTSLQSLRQTLGENSRLYSLIQATAKDLMIGAPLTKNRERNYREFEDADALPPEERELIVSNFEKDMITICDLAEKHNKQILIAMSATYEIWPPCFSFFQQETTDEQKNIWHGFYEDGLTKYNNKDFAAAILDFRKAEEIDSGVAILNHRLGMCYLNQGDSSQGRTYLRQAIDQDGFYSRSISPLHRKARELSAQYDRLHYVDVVSAFHTVMEGPVSDDDLFTDICHPSFLGHVIIGNVFLNQLVQREPFQSWKPHPGHNIEETDWRALSDKYKAELTITDSEQAQADGMHIAWYLDMAVWTAYQDRCYSETELLIDRFEQKHDGSIENRVYAKVSRARVAIARQDDDAAARLLNEAIDISPRDVENILNYAAWNHRFLEEFENAGVTLNRQGRFQRRSGPAID